METKTAKSKVRVVLRVRPFLSREIAASSSALNSCVSVRDSESCEEVTVHLRDPDSSRIECYQLDSFFGPDGNSVFQIFEREVKPLIPGIFEGYDSTVFASGATGSGKTFTMQGTEKLPGLMPLAMNTILSMCEKTSSRIEISYFEVYMDKCFDLLAPKTKEIAVLDDKEGKTHLRGLSQLSVKSMSEFQELYCRGVQRRKDAHTGLNDVSSRSHGILVISVSTPHPGSSGEACVGKLNLIDLAGNEDNKRTGNEGVRLQESAKIKQSLFALSNVIYALNNNKTRVPYRESKLTRILQDSLGGTSRALMVACLNPGRYQESVHTVSLAARSHYISNVSAQKLETAKKKVDMEARLESRGNPKSLSVSSTKKPNHQCHTKAKVNSHCATSNNKERTKLVPSRDLSNTKVSNNSSFESLKFAADQSEENVDGAESVLKPTTNSSDESSAEKKIEMTIPSRKPGSEKKMAMQTPTRKVLSPVNSNINQLPHEEELPVELKCKGVLEPKTPMTPYTATYANKLFTPASTPLDKIAAMSTALKNSLMQEYIDFLNIASREELLELKGIGVKMAEYIIELRESSPLKSLSDLEKLGLSSKQVQIMFSKAARGLFDRQEESTTGSWADSLLDQ